MFDTLIQQLNGNDLFPELTLEEQTAAVTNTTHYLNYIWELAECSFDAHTPAETSTQNFLMNKANVVGKVFVGEKLEIFPPIKILEWK